MKKAVVSVLVLLGTFALFFYFSQPQEGDQSGTITIKVYDETNQVVIDDVISFTNTKTLFQILDEEYSIGCANSAYQLDETCSFKQLNSHIVLSINDVITDWMNSYLEISIDGTRSNYGVDLIEVKDGSVYEFKFTDLGGDDS